jgi:hypothetical protein
VNFLHEPKDVSKALARLHLRVQAQDPGAGAAAYGLMQDLFVLTKPIPRLEHLRQRGQFIAELCGMSQAKCRDQVSLMSYVAAFVKENQCPVSSVAAPASRVTQVTDAASYGPGRRSWRVGFDLRHGIQHQRPRLDGGRFRERPVAHLA